MDILSNAPILAPTERTHRYTHSRSPSHSPSRPYSALGYDPLLRCLSPTSTLQAFTASIAGTTYIDSRSPSPRRRDLKASFSNVSAEKKELGSRAAQACLDIRSWTRELEAWEWPDCFEEPEPARKRARISMMSIGSLASSKTQTTLDDHDAENATFWGSLPANVVQEHDERLQEISMQLDDIDLEALKEFTLESHSPVIGGPEDDEDEKELKKLDDYTAVVTATILQTLPYVSKLVNLLDTWSARIVILKAIPSFLDDLEQMRTDFDHGWAAVAVSLRKNGEFAILGASNMREMEDLINAKMASLGQRLDHFLDLLEGREDCVPEIFLDKFEELEERYAEWVVMAQRRVLGDELKNSEASTPTAEVMRSLSVTGSSRVGRSMDTERARTPTILDTPIMDRAKTPTFHEVNVERAKTPTFRDAGLEQPKTHTSMNASVADFESSPFATPVKADLSFLSSQDIMADAKALPSEEYSNWRDATYVLDREQSAPFNVSSDEQDASGRSNNDGDHSKTLPSLPNGLLETPIIVTETAAGKPVKSAHSVKEIVPIIRPTSSHTQSGRNTSPARSSRHVPIVLPFDGDGSEYQPSPNASLVQLPQHRTVDNEQVTDINSKDINAQQSAKLDSKNELNVPTSGSPTKKPARSTSNRLLQFFKRDKKEREKDTSAEQLTENLNKSPFVASEEVKDERPKLGNTSTVTSESAIEAQPAKQSLDKDRSRERRGSIFGRRSLSRKRDNKTADDRIIWGGRDMTRSNSEGRSQSRSQSRPQTKGSDRALSLTSKKAGERTLSMTSRKTNERTASLTSKAANERTASMASKKADERTTTMLSQKSARGATQPDKQINGASTSQIDARSEQKAATSSNVEKSTDTTKNTTPVQTYQPKRLSRPSSSPKEADFPANWPLSDPAADRPTTSNTIRATKSVNTANESSFDPSLADPSLRSVSAMSAIDSDAFQQVFVDGFVLPTSEDSDEVITPSMTAERAARAIDNLKAGDTETYQKNDFFDLSTPLSSTETASIAETDGDISILTATPPAKKILVPTVTSSMLGSDGRQDDLSVARAISVEGLRQFDAIPRPLSEEQYKERSIAAVRDVRESSLPLGDLDHGEVLHEGAARNDAKVYFPVPPGASRPTSMSVLESAMALDEASQQARLPVHRAEEEIITPAPDSQLQFFDAEPEQDTSNLSRVEDDDIAVTPENKDTLIKRASTASIKAHAASEIKSIDVPAIRRSLTRPTASNFSSDSGSHAFTNASTAAGTPTYASPSGSTALFTQDSMQSRSPPVAHSSDPQITALPQLSNSGGQTPADSAPESRTNSLSYFNRPAHTRAGARSGAQSPTGSIDTPNFSRLRASSVDASDREPPLNRTMSKVRRKEPALETIQPSAEYSPDDVPPGIEDTLPPTSPQKVIPADEFDRQVSQVLEKLPAPIRFQTRQTPQSTSPRKTGEIKAIRPRQTLLPRQRSSSSAEPMTLAPAESVPKKSSGESQIKLYHLTQAGKDEPIKLFVRLVGEGERVMVRVGGGWSDLADFLKQYAEHHGSRTVSESEQGLKVMSAASTPPGSRRASGAAMNGGQRSNGRPGSRDDSAPASPSSPSGYPPDLAKVSKGRSVSGNVIANGSRPGSRAEGRRLLKKEPSREALTGEQKAKWVKGMLEKAKRETAAAAVKDAKGGEFGELGKVGSTRRVIYRSASAMSGSVANARDGAVTPARK